jgi:hypothetical protein
MVQVEELRLTQAVEEEGIIPPEDSEAPDGMVVQDVQ